MSAPAEEGEDAARRAAVLRACRILDTAPEPAFDALVARAAREAETPFAFIALHDGARLFFKAAHGAARREIERVEPIALDAMRAEEILWVSDVARAPAYAETHWARNPPFIRFFAACPLRLADGVAVGFLCVVGLKPRRRTQRLVRELRELALIASALIESRRIGALQAIDRIGAHERLLNSFIENAPAALAMFDRDMRYLRASPQWREDYGLGDVDLVGRSHYEIFPEIGEDWKEIHRNCLAGAIDRREGQKFVRADGSVQYLHWEVRPWRAAGDEIGGLIMITRDQTVEINALIALERARDHLAAARDAAEAANRSKSEFLANVGHEIRTPLNGVLGMAHALARADVPEDARALVRAIIESGDTILELLNDLLDGARIEAGQLSLNPAPFDLNDVVRGVATLNQTRAAAKGLKLKIETDVFPAPYFGDALRLKQVLLNLVGNAVKFTDVGEVRLAVSRAEAREPGSDLIRFRIIDTGPGFSEETRARLFRRFSQADHDTPARFGGSGLGLSICRGLVELMGGEIDCAAQPGKGAEFWVALALPRSVRSTPAQLEAPPLRVLCAEDHAVNRKVVELLLASCGCSVSFAENGAEAIAMWEAAHFDVILMDLQMPVMGGADAAREIRAREALSGRARTPIIAVSAAFADHAAEACLAVGMDGCVVKPFRPEQLFAAIRGAVEAQALPQPSEAAKAG
ncbi:MAG: ATP-binding protein [Hyphomonadaceae bacterium]